MPSKNPIHINVSFICSKCGAKNPPAKKTCRNHCRECLYSAHVDKNTPGDRQSNCKGPMIPIAITSDGKKGKQITHECLKCGTKKSNIVAEDDNLDQIIAVMKIQNTHKAKRSARRIKVYDSKHNIPNK